MYTISFTQVNSRERTQLHPSTENWIKDLLSMAPVQGWHANLWSVPYFWIGWRGRWEGGSGWGIHVNPWLIHVNVWQKPLQYCKVISLQLIKINGKKKKLMSIDLVMPSSHLILCHPLLLLPSIFPSIRVFSNESVLLIRWPNSLPSESLHKPLILFHQGADRLKTTITEN